MPNRAPAGALAALRAAALACAGLLAAVLAACGGSGGGGGSSGDTPPEWARVSALGGQTTNATGNQSSRGFDSPAPNLDADGLARHLAGDTEFEASFITAPSVDFPDRDGLGPAFNNTACLNCHVRDGRGSHGSAALNAPLGSWTRFGSDASLFLRLSIAAGDADCAAPSAANRYCAPQAVPGFATQLFHRSVLALRPDSPFSGLADFAVRFDHVRQVTYADGTQVTLRQPSFQIRNPYDHPGEVPTAGVAPASRVLQPDVATSPRMGLPMFGLGLLEAIPEADILAGADPDDRDGDGISGRPNWVYDPVKAARGDPEPRSLGRFGWKAGTPSVLVQSAGAYRDDMGITNVVFPEENIAGLPLYASYLGAHPGDDGQAATGYEVSEAVLGQVVFYSSTLAVPARRNVDDPQVLLGAARFVGAGCDACHTPSFMTGTHPGIALPSGTLPVAAASNQRIYPFTDLLLHDMGADLADHRTEFAAGGREWKTRPLWGIGLTQTVNALAGFLHDGRARTLEEAILWHGGEAEAAREAFRTMSAADREALLAFLRSL